METILAPSCATAECHSAVRAQSGDVFDNVENTRATFDNRGDLVLTCETLKPAETYPCVDDAVNNSYLWTVLSTGVESDKGRGDLMPLDQGLPNSDYNLIHEWIETGANGYVPKVTTP